MALACIFTIFLAGPDDCQNMYMAAKKAPQHRAPDFVEVRQDDVFAYQDLLQLSYECVPPISLVETIYKPRAPHPLPLCNLPRLRRGVHLMRIAAELTGRQTLIELTDVSTGAPL